jgi:hypothetical protein
MAIAEYPPDTAVDVLLNSGAGDVDTELTDVAKAPDDNEAESPPAEPDAKGGAGGGHVDDVPFR